MAIEHPNTQRVTRQRTETVTAAVLQDRTYRAVIEAPLVGPYHIAVYREDVLRDAGGAVIQTTKVAAPVLRLASAIAAETVTLTDGSVISAAAIFEAFPLFFDRWASEDITAGRR